MAVTENKMIKDFVDAIKTGTKEKTKAYESPATVTRIENGVAWVHVPGGVEETPVQLTIAASEGDQVRVRVANGRATIVGNVTSPPTDDRTAREALYNANVANLSARSAEASASAAKQYAEVAKQTTDEINAYADTVGKTVTQVLEDGETAGEAAQQAKDSADNAKQSADTARASLSQVQSVLEVAQWIATHGTYVKATTFNPNATYYTITATQVATPSDDDKDSDGVLIYYELDNGIYVRTTDTSVQAGKTYYNAVGTPVAQPSAEHIADYYTLNVTDAMADYIKKHLALTNDGLYVMADGSKWKVLITDDGMYIVDDQDMVIAEYNHSGLEVKTEEGTSIYKLSAGESSTVSASEIMARHTFDSTGSYSGTFTKRLSDNSKYVSTDFVITVTYRGKALTTNIGRTDTTVKTIIFPSGEIAGDSLTVTIQQTDTTNRIFEITDTANVTITTGEAKEVQVSVAYSYYGSNPSLRFGTQSTDDNPAWSTSFGENLIVTEPYSAHFGKYNADKEGLIFSVGSGDERYGRHNALEITKNGGTRVDALASNNITTQRLTSGYIDEPDTDVTYGEVKIGNFYAPYSLLGGRSGSITVPANSYKDVTVRFRNKDGNVVWSYFYEATPKVIASIYSTATAGAIGSLSVSVLGYEYDGNDDIIGFKARVFNAGSSQRAPAIDWIAIPIYA